MGNTPSQYRRSRAPAGTNDDMTECADCAADFDHCHGTLVTHGDGTVECTDQACVLLDPLRHPLIIDCAIVLGGCCLDEAQRKGLPRAS